MAEFQKNRKLAEKPKFFAGKNIAMKIPPTDFDNTMQFYQDVLGLKKVAEDGTSIAFQFGDMRLWLDKVDQLSRAEIWLEIRTDDTPSAKAYFNQRGIIRRDEIEPLPANLDGFWISNPAGIIHLICND
jgi:hypothetical protein